MGIKLIKKIESKDLELDIYKNDTEQYSKIVLESENETIFSIDFNEKGGAVLSIHDGAYSCSIEDTTSLKEVLDSRIMTNDSLSVETARAIIGNDEKVATASENITSMLEVIKEYNDSAKEQNSLEYQSLSKTIEEEKFFLNENERKIESLTSEINQKFEKITSEGNEKYGALIKVDGQPTFFEFTPENKKIITDSWNNEKFDKSDIKKWHSLEKEFSKLKSELNNELKIYENRENEIVQKIEQLQSINPMDTTIVSFSLESSQLNIKFESESIRHFTLDSNSYETLTKGTITKVFEYIENEKQAVSGEEIDYKKILSNEESFKQFLVELDGTDDFEIKNFCYDSKNGETTFIHKNEDGTVSMNIKYDENRKEFIIKAFDVSGKPISVEGETELRTSVSSLKLETEFNYNENQVSSFNTETSKLSYRNAERIEFSLENGQVVEVNAFDTKYGMFYEMQIEGKTFETENKEELIKAIKNIENGLPVEFKEDSDKYKNSFVLTKLEVVQEKIHDIGSENVLSNKNLENERVLYSCFSVLGDHSLSDIEKGNKIEKIIEKSLLSQTEISDIRQTLELYNNFWENNNNEHNNPTPETVVEKGEVAKFSVNEMFAKQMIRYDSGESDFKVNTLYFDKEKFRFQTGYTYKENGKVFVKFNEKSQPFDITGSERYQDLSHVVAAISKNGSSSFYEIFREIGINYRTDLTPQTVKELQEIISGYDLVFRKDFDDQKVDKKFFATQAIINDITRNTDVMKEMYASINHSGVSEKEQEESWLEQLHFYEDNFENNNEISCVDEPSADLNNYNNLLTEKQNCLSGMEGVKAKVDALNHATKLHTKGFSAYYHPLTAVLTLPLLLFRNAVFGHSVKVKNIETGQTEKVRVRLTPAEVFKLYPAVYTYSQYGKYVDLRKEYLLNKGTLQLLEKNEARFIERYGSIENVVKTIELDSRIDNLIEKCNELLKENNETIEKTKNEIESKNKDIKTIDNNIEKSKKEIEKNNNEIKENNEKIKKINHDKNLSPQEKKEKVKDLESKNKKLEEKNTKLIERKEQNEKIKIRLNEEKNKLEGSLKKLETSNNDIKKTIEKLDDTKSKLESDPKSNIEKVEKTVETVESNVEKIEKGEPIEKTSENNEKNEKVKSDESKPKTNETKVETSKQESEQSTSGATTDIIKTKNENVFEGENGEKIITREIDGTTLLIETTHVDDRITKEIISDIADPNIKFEDTDANFTEIVTEIAALTNEMTIAEQNLDETFELQELFERFETTNPNSSINVEEGEKGERIIMKGEKVELTTSKIIEVDEDGNPLSLENTKVNVVLIDPEKGIRYNFGENSMSLTKTDINQISITFNKLNDTKSETMSERINELKESLYRVKTNFGIESITTPEGETIKIDSKNIQEVNDIIGTLGFEPAVETLMNASLESLPIENTGTLVEPKNNEFTGNDISNIDNNKQHNYFFDIPKDKDRAQIYVKDVEYTWEQSETNKSDFVFSDVVDTYEGNYDAYVSEDSLSYSVEYTIDSSASEAVDEIETETSVQVTYDSYAYDEQQLNYSYEDSTKSLEKDFDEDDTE